MLDWLVDRECMTVCLVLTLTLFFAVHAGAMGSSPKVSPTVGQKQDSSVEKFASDPRVKQPEALRKAFDQHGTARLIINIDPPGAMAGYDRQEDRVKAALDRFINSLSAQNAKGRYSQIFHHLRLCGQSDPRTTR